MSAKLDSLDSTDLESVTGGRMFVRPFSPLYCDPRGNCFWLYPRYDGYYRRSRYYWR